VAIVQISQITNRKGLAENLPQLAGAELGWSTDTRQLWIGNGTLEDGAPVVGNTEILTEFSDILNLSTTYTYKGQAAGYTVQTGPTADNPVTLSLQSWLDQFASVLDFGALGDGVTDDTDAINRALYQLYCRENNPQIRRSLFFPAGVYVITQSINIPPYATLYGEGPDNSIIQLSVGDDSTLHECVARTADSLQQIGVNIGSGGATPPTFITVSNMAFKSQDPTVDVFIAESATNCKFTNVSFEGPLTTADLTTAADNTNAVAFRGTATDICDQIVFDNCRFLGTTYGSKPEFEIKSVVFTNSKFNTLYQGIVLDTDVTGTRIVSNQFDNIYAEGIVFESMLIPGLNASGHNIFYDVGNHFLGAGNPFTSIIDIQSNNNISVSDMFVRNDADAQVYPRINLNNTVSIATTNGQQLSMGSYTRQTGQTTVLINDQSDAALEINTDVITSVSIDYTIKRGTGIRTGKMFITAETLTGTLTWTDDFVENTDIGITLSVNQTANLLTVDYLSIDTGLNADFFYSITYLA
jgi:hypothetical protein